MIVNIYEKLQSFLWQKVSAFLHINEGVIYKNDAATNRRFSSATLTLSCSARSRWIFHCSSCCFITLSCWHQSRLKYKQCIGANKGKCKVIESCGVIHCFEMQANRTSKSHKQIAQANRTSKSHKPIAQANRTSQSHKQIAQANHTSKSHKPIAQANRTSQSHKPIAQANRTSQSHKPIAQANRTSK